MSNEERLIEYAILLDQSREGRDRAMARAIRGVVIPVVNHIGRELDRSTTPDTRAELDIVVLRALALCLASMCLTVAPDHRNRYAKLMTDAITEYTLSTVRKTNQS